MNKFLTPERIGVLSIIFYVACLASPGFYVEKTQSESFGISLLLTGWLGVFYGYFSWIANPLYMIAYVNKNRNPGFSASWAAISYIVALEFLFHKSIVKDEGGGSVIIAGVGWGYFFWLMAFLTLCYSSMKKIVDDKKVTGVLLLVMVAHGIIFWYSYFFSDTSHYRLLKRRDDNFSELCRQAGETFFYKPTAPITGIFFSEHGGAGYEGFLGNHYRSSSYGAFGSGGDLRIPFVEIKNDNSRSPWPYIRRIKNSTKYEFVAELKSNYFVMINDLAKEVPSELAISGREIVIREKGRDQPIAKMAYAVSRVDSRFCGKVHNNRFYESDFIFRALEKIP